VVDHGNPEDLQRQVKVFGAPAEDQELDRLEALATWRRNESNSTIAHTAWQAYERAVNGSCRRRCPQASAESGSGHWIWHRMGENAAKMPGA